MTQRNREEYEANFIKYNSNEIFKLLDKREKIKGKNPKREAEIDEEVV